VPLLSILARRNRGSVPVDGEITLRGLEFEALNGTAADNVLSRDIRDRPLTAGPRSIDEQWIDRNRHRTRIRVSAIGTNPNLPSRLRSGRYRVKTRPSATRGQHCNSATSRQLTQFARRCGSFTTSGAGPLSTTRARRPLWSLASRTLRLWLLPNPKAVTIVTNKGRTRTWTRRALSCRRAAAQY